MATTGSVVVAERYARALLDVVQDKKADPQEIGNEIQEVADLMDAQPELANVLSTPTIPTDERLAVLNELFATQKLAPSTLNLLRLLTTRERIPIMREIDEQYRRLVLELKGVQPGVVTSVAPLTDEQQKRLAESLGKALGKTMELSYRTDPELVGGLVVRIGNRVFDASVVTQLRRFKEKALSSL